MSLAYLSWTSVDLGVLVLFGIGAAFLAAVWRARTQDAINTQLVRRQGQETSLRTTLRRNRVAGLLAAASFALVLAAAVLVLLSEDFDNRALRGEIDTLRRQIDSVPDHYRMLSMSAEQQQTLLANLKAAGLGGKLGLISVFSACGSEETRVASEMTATLRDVPMSVFYSPYHCGPDPFHQRKGIFMYLVDGSQAHPEVKDLIRIFSEAGIDLTVEHGTAAQLGRTMGLVTFYVDGD